MKFILNGKEIIDLSNYVCDNITQTNDNNIYIKLFDINGNNLIIDMDGSKDLTAEYTKYNYRPKKLSEITLTNKFTCV